MSSSKKKITQDSGESKETSPEGKKEPISSTILPDEKGRFPRGLRRCNFVDGKIGDDLFLQYLEQFAQYRYERTKKQLEKWMESEATRIDELRDKYAGVSDPKKALQRQIERLQKRLVSLQNG